MRKNILLDSQTTNKHFFGEPQNLFRSIYRTPFARGLPQPQMLRRTDIAEVFKKAIAEDGIIVDPRFEQVKSNEFQTLQSIWRNGWLHAETSEVGVRYVFATQLHRW